MAKGDQLNQMHSFSPMTQITTQTTQEKLRNAALQVTHPVVDNQYLKSIIQDLSPGCPAELQTQKQLILLLVLVIVTILLWSCG